MSPKITFEDKPFLEVGVTLRRYSIYGDTGEVAYCKVQYSSSIDPYVKSLYVQPSSRGAGLGCSLMRRVLEDFAERRIWLTVLPFGDKPKDEKQLISYYEGLGWSSDKDDPEIMFLDPRKRRGSDENSKAR